MFPATVRVSLLFLGLWVIVSYSTSNSESLTDDFELDELLGLGQHKIALNKPMSFKNAASKFLLKVYYFLRRKAESGTTRLRFTRSTLITPEEQEKIDSCNNIITFACGKNKSGADTSGDLRLEFNMENIPNDLQLIRAELRVFQNSKMPRDTVKHLNLSVFSEGRPQGVHDNMKTSFNTTTDFEGWLEVNITRIVSEWLLEVQHVSKRHYLTISLQPIDHYHLRSITEDIRLIDQTGDDEYQPFIIGYFNGPEFLKKLKFMRFKRNVEKRAARPYDEYSEMEEPCQKRSLMIEFRDLYMSDWVIAPEKLDAFYCAGTCNFPLNSRMNATNHAIMQTLLHVAQPYFPPACCAPSELGPMTLLHYVTNMSASVSTHQGSIIKTCGCI